MVAEDEAAVATSDRPDVDLLFLATSRKLLSDIDAELRQATA